MKEYKVKVLPNCVKWYNLNGQLHRVEGPAIEYDNGWKCWYLEGCKLSEEEFLERMKLKPKLEDKIAIIDGKKYCLTLVNTSD